MNIPFEDEARTLAGKIMNELAVRSGFDDAWNNCDIDTQLEIMAELQKICVKALGEASRS